MSKWPNKFVIGLTGNIATGKSIVRRMLEHIGAFGIDADALGHRAIQPGAPAYQPVIDAFGRYILKENGQIDRDKLGQVVFGEPEALKLLESIVHPVVREGIDILVRRSKSKVVVVEAIKLLESPLHEACDVIWVVTADLGLQHARLKRQRGMDKVEIDLRIAAQSSPAEKVARANTVIENSGSIEETWEQVRVAWKHLFPQPGDETAPLREEGRGAKESGGLRVIRARPLQAEEIAAFISGVRSGRTPVTRQMIMDSFGEKAYLLLYDKEGLKGLLGWKVENLVTRVDVLYILPSLTLPKALPFLIAEMEEASKELQCEIALLFVEPKLAAERELWSLLGYEERLPVELTVGAWSDAALESAQRGMVMLFKQLRADRVLRPI